MRTRLIVGLLCVTGVVCPRLHADVTVVRDDFGVPHVFAGSVAELGYGVAMAQCEDNAEVVVYCLFAGVGRLAELHGAVHVGRDIEARRLAHGHFARRDWPKLDARLRALIRGYCDGVNDYLKEHADGLPFSVPKVEPHQVLARHRQIMSLTAVQMSQAEAELSRTDGYHPVYNPQRVGELEAPSPPPGKSNSWALSGSKTAAGAPMLLIDPHWMSEGHLQLYEAQLHGDGLRIGGFMLNGTPLPGLAYTPYAAWTVTAGGADSSDAFALRINPENPNQYEFDGEWADMHVRTETVRVRQPDGSFRQDTIDLRFTRHGPVLRTKGDTPYAAAFAGWDRADAMEQSFRMAKARTLEEFKAAIALDRMDYFNLMWATRDGHIGYVQTGRVPLRRAGFNWSRLVPGWTSAALYRGMIPFEDLPQVQDPATGFLQNCNTAANVVTPGLKFTRKDFPIGALHGHYGRYRARGQRATELLADVRKADWPDARRIAFDTYVPPADLWVPLIVKAFADAPAGLRDDALLRGAVDRLRDWDRYATRESTGATIFRLWRLECSEITGSRAGRDAFVIPDTPTVRADALEALRRAAVFIEETYGSLDVPWGQIKRLRRGDRQWAISGDGLNYLGMDTLRATAAAKLDENHRLIMNGGQCITSVVLLTDPLRVRTVVAYGQSNQPDSPHYDDQAPLFAEERFREVRWGRDRLAGHVESERTYPYNPNR